MEHQKKAKLNEKYTIVFILFQVLKILLIKQIQLPVFLFLVVFYQLSHQQISILQHFSTSFNTIWKKVFVTNFFFNRFTPVPPNIPADKWTFKKRTKDIHLWTFRKPPILVQLGNPKKHSILNLLWGFTYECSMYLHINSRKHENISLPFNHCFCGVCCLEILKIKHWRH